MLTAESGGKCVPEDGLPEKSDSTTDSRDPAVEQKIVLKIESLRERLTVWARRMEELVYFIFAVESNHSINIRISPEVGF